MKWGQKGIIKKALQRFIKGGLFKTAIRLSTFVTTKKDWKKEIKVKILLYIKWTASQILPLYFIQKGGLLGSMVFKSFDPMSRLANESKF